MKTLCRFLLILTLLTGAAQARETPKVGEQAPDFQLTTLTGRSFKLSQLRGKVVVLNFFATWCPSCLQELPQLEKEVWKGLKSKDLEVLAVGREETVAKLQEFCKKAHLTLPMAADPKREVYSRYAEKTIPRTFLIDRKGKIVAAVEDYETASFEGFLAKLKSQIAVPLPRDALDF